MKCKINNKPYDFDAPISVQTLIDEVLNISENGVAIAINDQILLKKSWDRHFLADDDEILLIRATQGG
ncbi:MAG: sulfur carrier protein ThiS [Bacteroidales bacterium]